MYCKQNNRRGKYKQTQFDFLGFSFQPRRIYEVKDGKVNLWWGYCAAISTKAARHIRNQIRKYKVHRDTGAELEQIAQSLAPKLCGWIRYFHLFYPSALREVFSALNARLVGWITNKYKRYRRRKYHAWQKLKEIARDFPYLFEHWKYGYTP